MRVKSVSTLEKGRGSPIKMGFTFVATALLISSFSAQTANAQSKGERFRAGLIAIGKS